MFACIRNLLHLDKWRGRVSSISRHQWFWSATLMPVWRFLSFQGLLYSKFLIKTGKLKVIKFSKFFFYSVCVVSRVFIHINNMAVPNFDRIHLLVQIPRSRQHSFSIQNEAFQNPKEKVRFCFITCCELDHASLQIPLLDSFMEVWCQKDDNSHCVWRYKNSSNLRVTKHEILTLSSPSSRTK